MDGNDLVKMLGDCLLQDGAIALTVEKLAIAIKQVDLVASVETDLIGAVYLGAELGFGDLVELGAIGFD